MPTVQVLLEIERPDARAFERFDLATAGMDDSRTQVLDVADGLVGLGVELVEDLPPVPMVDPATVGAFAEPTESADVAASTVVVGAEVASSCLDELASRDGVTVWPSSPIDLYGCRCGGPVAGALGVHRPSTNSTPATSSRCWTCRTPQRVSTAARSDRESRCR